MSETLTTTNYTIDTAHSTVRFWVRHLMISKTHGEISGVTGAVSHNPADPGSTTIDVTLDASTLTTGHPDRDGHLKSGDFLDVATYPTITFKSTSVKKLSDTEFELDGDLTLHGVSKSVKLNAEVTPEVASPFGGFKIGVSATGVINRDDYGIVWNQALETGGVMVGKEIHLQIDLELDRPA